MEELLVTKQGIVHDLTRKIQEVRAVKDLLSKERQSLMDFQDILYKVTLELRSQLEMMNSDSDASIPEVPEPIAIEEEVIPPKRSPSHRRARSDLLGPKPAEETSHLAWNINLDALVESAKEPSHVSNLEGVIKILVQALEEEKRAKTLLARHCEELFAYQKLLRVTCFELWFEIQRIGAIPKAPVPEYSSKYRQTLQEKRYLEDRDSLVSSRRSSKASENSPSPVRRHNRSQSADVSNGLPDELMMTASPKHSSRKSSNRRKSSLLEDEEEDSDIMSSRRKSSKGADEAEVRRTPKDVPVSPKAVHHKRKTSLVDLLIKKATKASTPRKVEPEQKTLSNAPESDPYKLEIPIQEIFSGDEEQFVFFPNKRFVTELKVVAAATALCRHFDKKPEEVADLILQGDASVSLKTLEYLMKNMPSAKEWTCLVSEAQDGMELTTADRFFLRLYSAGNVEVRLKSLALKLEIPELLQRIGEQVEITEEAVRFLREHEDDLKFASTGFTGIVSHLVKMNCTKSPLNEVVELCGNLNVELQSKIMSYLLMYIARRRPKMLQGLSQLQALKKAQSVDLFLLHRSLESAGNKLNTWYFESDAMDETSQSSDQYSAQTSTLNNLKERFEEAHKLAGKIAEAHGHSAAQWDKFVQGMVTLIETFASVPKT